MKIFKILLLSFFMVSLSACVSSRYSTKKRNYLKNSKTLPPIMVPPGAATPAQKPYYVVPSMGTVSSYSDKPSLKPPGLLND